ncbi:unnamed protein product [Paramecium sonneborni]|uniref:Uncharacterized protein n=1 Tax=Paramecium sonneborni TaxID=65129 RepID=A0A8S1LPF1_9CILI|nr:unnamed protein product [Paramecium sonneborni]
MKGNFKSDKKYVYEILYFLIREKGAGEFIDDFLCKFDTFFDQSCQVIRKWVQGILFD